MSGKGWFIEIERPAGKERINLGSFIVRIGSDPDNFLRLRRGPQAAPHHCQLEPFSAGFLIRDISNGLGVTLNDRHVDAEVLHDGDRIDVADLTLFFRRQEAGSGPPVKPTLRDDLSELASDYQQAPPPPPTKPSLPLPATPLPVEAVGPAVAAYADSDGAAPREHRRKKNKSDLKLSPTWLVVIIGVGLLIAVASLLWFTLPSNQPRIDKPIELHQLSMPSKVTPTPKD